MTWLLVLLLLSAAAAAAPATLAGETAVRSISTCRLPASSLAELPHRRRLSMRLSLLLLLLTLLGMEVVCCRRRQRLRIGERDLTGVRVRDGGCNCCCCG